MPASPEGPPADRSPAQAARAAAPPTPEEARRPPQWRHRAKRLVFVLVLAFVLQQVWTIAREGNWSEMRLRPLPIAGALCAYWLGWLPSVWVWRWLLRAMDRPVPWGSAIRAYYVGHLGKYVPGKAMVLVLRSQLLGGEGVPGLSAALTATYETLLMMGVGLWLGLVLVPASISADQWNSVVPVLRLSDGLLHVLPGLVTAAGLACLPVVSRLFQFVAWKVARRESGTKEIVPVYIPLRLVLAGAAALCLGWFCHGASLGLVLAGVGGPAFSVWDWPFWSGAVAFATSVGFLAVFAPGGLGVREGLLIALLLLHPEVQQAQAVAAAVLLRAVWLVAEVAAGGALYWGVRGSRASQAVEGEHSGSDT